MHGKGVAFENFVISVVGTRPFVFSGCVGLKFLLTEFFEDEIDTRSWMFEVVIKIR